METENRQPFVLASSAPNSAMVAMGNSFEVAEYLQVHSIDKRYIRLARLDQL